MTHKISFIDVQEWLKNNDWNYISGVFLNTRSALEVTCSRCGAIRSFYFFK